MFISILPAVDMLFSREQCDITFMIPIDDMYLAII